MTSGLSVDEIGRALDGDREAMRQLVTRLRPIIHAEVGHLLFRIGNQQGWDPRQECRDFVQEVFVELLAKQGKVLRSWDPTRGSTLEGFVRLVARRHVIGVLRSKRRNPWSEQALTTERLDERVGDGPLDGRAEARAQLSHTFDRLEQRLDARGLMLFHLLYIEQRPVEEVCELSGMSRDALYAWRFRFKKILQQVKSEMELNDDRA